MELEEQLSRLYKIQEDIRIVQESGLWEPLHESKLRIIKLIIELEDLKLSKVKSSTSVIQIENDKLKSEIRRLKGLYEKK